MSAELGLLCATRKDDYEMSEESCGTMQPFEVSYVTTGRNGKKIRNVIAVICPTAMAQHMRLAKPIFVSLGDVPVDWSAPVSNGYRAMFKSLNVLNTTGR